MAKVVLLTGAAGGMGRAIARAAVASGRRVVLVDRDGLSLEAFAAELGEAACAIDVDVTDRARVDRLPELVPEPFQPIDVLINNAGHDIGGGARGGPRPAAHPADNFGTKLIRTRRGTPA